MMEWKVLKKENIVLTGFMGTGKTAVGRQLASRLNMNFIDTDVEVEYATGLKIHEIFKRYGEQRFRAEERTAVEKAAGFRNTVIATGGGVVLDPENMQNLRKSGVIVLLEARPEVIARRVRRHNNRPLLANRERLIERIENLLQERAPYYEDCDCKIDTSDLSIQGVVDKIVAVLRERGWEWNLK